LDKAAHFDLDGLAMLEEVMEEEFPELVRVFLQDSSPRCEALRSAFAAQDSEQVREIAHSFKGASANLSAVQLAELCFVVETAGRENNLAGLNDKIDAIEAEFAQVKAIFQTMI